MTNSSSSKLTFNRWLKKAPTGSRTNSESCRRLNGVSCTSAGKRSSAGCEVCSSCTSRHSLE
ncbi:hypothetical protein D3C77_797640 [compost metagenome]